MVDNQLRIGANTLGRLLSIRGSRVDARGIEVQGELDPDGQLTVVEDFKGVQHGFVQVFQIMEHKGPRCRCRPNGT